MIRASEHDETKGRPERHPLKILPLIQAIFSKDQVQKLHDCDAHFEVDFISRGSPSLFPICSKSIC